MKRLRILSFLVLTLGVIYLALSGLSIYYYRKMIALLNYYGVSDDVQLDIPEVAQTRAQLMSGFIIFLILGVIVLCVGIGLYLAKSWARKMWLVLVCLLTAFHLLRLVSDYHQSKFILLERIGEVVLIGSLAALSWLWLQRESIKRDAHGTEAAG